MEARQFLSDGAKTEDAAATFRNGVLEITMPVPKVETSTRKLEIKEPTEGNQTNRNQ